MAESTDADVYQIEPSVPYTSADLNYYNAEVRLAIAGSQPSLNNYEVVYLGYPKMEYGISPCT